MNKYQEALYKILEDNPKSKLTTSDIHSSIRVLHELIDKANKYDELQKIFDDRHICEIKSKFNKIECNADRCDTCPLQLGDEMCLKITFEDKWNFQEERDELKQKLQQLVDKETPKKSIERLFKQNKHFKICPSCWEKDIKTFVYGKYCDECGQRLE